METVPRYGPRAGLSLIELMIVLAIMGGLLMVGIPQYRSHLIRSRVMTILQSVQTVQGAVLEYMVWHGQGPSHYELLGLSMIDEPLIERLDLAQGGALVVLAHPGRLGLDSGTFLRIRLAPKLSDHGARWLCSGEGAVEYLPHFCEKTAALS